MTLRTLLLLVAWLQDASRPATRPTSQPAAFARLPGARYEHQALAVGATIYVLGGTTPRADATARVDAFDPATRRWRACAPMLEARTFFAAAEVGGLIFALGGNESRSVESYDPAKDRWTQRPPMPAGRTHLTAAGFRGQLWALGGFLGPHAETKGGRSAFTARVDIYDPATDQWTRGPDLPRALHGHRAVVLGDELHVLGGTEDFTDLAAHWVLDRGTWRPRASMQHGRIFFGAEAVAGRILAVSGPRQSVESYDPKTDRWTFLAECPLPVYHFDTAVVGQTLYTFGGTRPEPATDTSALDLVLALDVAQGTWR